MRRRTGTGFERPLALFAGLLCAPAAALAEAPPDPVDRPPSQAIEARLGALLPAQVLDGLNLRVEIGWRAALGHGFWLPVSLGAQRTTITALTARIDAPGQSLTLRADHAQWTLPALAGVGWQSSGPGAQLGLAALFGVAWIHATLDSEVVGGEDDRRRTDARVDGLLVGRVDLSWAMAFGAAVVGGGWQSIVPFGDPAPTGDVRVTGTFVEAGWRAGF
ncbi:MAG: hypothetical protein H6704_01000 [Myxococcales bacterium]|nr:hypothetical protein [Myxococcales bacterium]MCB9534827.1 hypothetical protein [Myxococcales bacterium]